MHPHELLRVDGVCFVKDNANLLVMSSKCSNSGLEFVANVKLVCIKKKQNAVTSACKPFHNTSIVVRASDALLLASQYTRGIYKRDEVENISLTALSAGTCLSTLEFIEKCSTKPLERSMCPSRPEGSFLLALLGRRENEDGASDPVDPKELLYWGLLGATIQRGGRESIVFKALGWLGRSEDRSGEEESEDHADGSDGKVDGEDPAEADCRKCTADNGAEVDVSVRSSFLNCKYGSLPGGIAKCV